MALKLAFLGFRHFHIVDVYKRAAARDDIEIVAACEEDAASRDGVPAPVELTHESFDDLLDNVDCDAVAIGDYYGRRGEIAVKALQRGKHVVSDKPFATSLDEIAQIDKLSTEKNLTVMCQFDMVASAKLNALHDLVADGRLGEIHQIGVTGQHPLNYGTRPQWYFEEGKHGGTLNDIAIHAMHAMPWMTGHDITQVVAARTWNAFATEVPHFMDSAQAMLTLSNGCGVLMDVSYAMPKSHGYSLVQYWRFTLYGTKGIAETSDNMDHIAFAEEGKKEIEKVGPKAEVELNYLDAFVSQCAGGDAPSPLTTAEVIKAQRQSLELQDAADRGKRDVTL